MKKSFVFFIAAACLLACQKEGTTLSLSEQTLSFDSSASTQTIKVEANGDFSVECTSADWYTVSNSIAKGMGYGAVSVTVEQNKTASSRSGEVVVKTAYKEERITFVQARPSAPSDPETTQKTLNKHAHSFSVEMSSDTYESVAVSDVDWITFSDEDADNWTAEVAENTTGETRTGVITVTTTDGLTISTVEVEQQSQSVLEGELVIEEVYFAGVLLEDGKSSTASDGDQYIRITNNTDETVYADGILFCTSSYMSNRASTGSYWTPQEIPTDAIGINTAYQIPGDGHDVPVEAGASLILAISAQDFSGSGGADLSQADFEFYYSGSEYFPDVDNPDVPNLNMWFQSSWSYFILHQRGYESYALVCPPAGMDAETFMAMYPWIGKEDFILRGEYYKTRDILAGNYLVPNELVVDGVNCAVEQFLGDLAFNASVDAGYTGCGTVDSDPERFGTSARRNASGDKLADTNNSTNDFTRSATPTFME